MQARDNSKISKKKVVIVFRYQFDVIYLQVGRSSFDTQVFFAEQNSAAIHSVLQFPVEPYLAVGTIRGLIT